MISLGPDSSSSIIIWKADSSARASSCGLEVIVLHEIACQRFTLNPKVVGTDLENRSNEDSCSTIMPPNAIDRRHAASGIKSDLRLGAKTPYKYLTCRKASNVQNNSLLHQQLRGRIQNLIPRVNTFRTSCLAWKSHGSFKKKKPRYGVINTQRVQAVMLTRRVGNP